MIAGPSDGEEFAAASIITAGAGAFVKANLADAPIPAARPAAIPEARSASEGILCWRCGLPLRPGMRIGATCV